MGTARRDIPMLPQLLRQRADERPHGVIVESVDGDSLTYRQLIDASARWAAAYAALGVTERDRVVSIMSLGVEWFRHWGALMWLGAVDVPLNTEYRGDLLAHAVNTAAASTIVTTTEHLERLDAVADQLREVDTVVVLDAAEPPPGHDRWRIVAHPERQGPLAAAAPASPQRWDIASVLFTSGTTGPSKGVLVPWAQLHATAVSSFPFEDLGPDDTMYLPSVTYHLGPKYALYAMSLLDGRIVIRNRFSATAFWDDIERHRCTTTVLVSSMVPLVASAEPTPDDAATPLRNVLMAPPPPTVDEFKERFDVRVSTCFNMTEVNVPVNSGWTVGSANHTSCGRPRPGVEVRIVDEHDIEVDVGAVGELMVRADEPWTLNAGYIGQPEATARAWRNGWFHTGDGFRRDAEGNYYFVDRIKDSIRRRGENISSFEVEGCVNQHHDVLESAAVAVPSPLGEDEVMVFAVPRPDSSLTPAALIEDLRDRMPRFMVPRYVELVDALPKTPTDRIQKARLRERGVGPATFDREGAQQR